MQDRAYKKLWSSEIDIESNWKEAAVTLQNGTFSIGWIGTYGTNNNGSSNLGQTQISLADISSHDGPCPASTQGDYNSK